MNLNIRLLLLCLFICLATSAQEEELGLLPMDVLLQESNQHTFTISPNGKYFTEVVESANPHLYGRRDSHLYIVDIDNYELLHKIPMTNGGIDELYWLTNKRLIYESNGAIKAVDIDGDNPMEIVGRRDKIKKYSYRNRYKRYRHNTILNLLRDKPHQVLVQTYDYNLHAAVKEINVFSGFQYVRINAEKHKVNHWITDAFGNVRLAIKFNENGRQFFTYDEETDTLEPFYITIEGKQYSLTIDPEEYLQENLTFESFGYDTDIIYITSNVTNDKRKLLSYNIKTNEVESVIVDDVNCDVKDLGGEDFRFIVDYPNHKIAGVKYSGLTPQYKWFDADYDSMMRELTAKHPQFFNEILDTDRTGTRLLVYQWSDAASGNIGVYDTSDGSYKMMFNFNDELDKFELSKSKNIIVKARDGHKLPGYLNFPPGYQKGDSLPLVVVPHGGPWARDYWGIEPFSQYFSSRGYAVLRVNFRGSTGFGKEHAMAGIKSLDKVMINDIADATKHVTSNYSINQEEVFIFGHSYGGYAAYMGLLKYPDLFKSAVAVSAPTDLDDCLKHQKKNNYKYSYEFWTAVLGSNKSKYLATISPISFTSEISKPVLIFHGRQDEIIPVTQAEEMAAKLKKDGKDVKVEILNTEGHSFSDSNVLGYVLEQSHEFFQKQLPKE